MPDPSRSRSTEDPISAGEILSGRFRVVRRIAQGGMGVVYEAFDEKLGRRIALKCAVSGEGRRLFPEVRLATEVSHPNICRIYEIHSAETAQGNLEYFTMEYLGGPTLAARIASGPVPREEAGTIARQLCAGLVEAHRNGIIHGDLKPGNVILTKGPGGTPRAVIADFGLARAALTPGAAGGTPGYMAPELKTGAPATVASDIYALGVILHELASGYRPDERAAMLMSTVTQSGNTAAKLPESTAHLPAKLAPLKSSWDPIVRKCLDPSPEQRYRRVEEIQRALGPSTLRRRLVRGAAAVALAAAAALVTYRQATAPPETVRLELSAVAAPAELAAEARQIQQNAARRISQLRNSRQTAFSLSSFRATHRLSTRLAPEAGGLALHALLLNLQSNTPVTEWSADYQAAQARYIPVALAGVVSGALHLPALATYASVDGAAREPYRNGLAELQDDGKIEAALASLTEAERLEPDSALPWAALAEAQRRKYFLTNAESWEDLAMASWRQAELRNPDCAPVHRIAGLLEYDQNHIEQAITRMRRATEFQPPNADAVHRLGLLYERHGQLFEALQAYNEALRLAPHNTRIYEDLAHAYTAQSDFAAASAILRRAVDLAPDRPNLRQRLASSYQDQGRFDQAEAELRSALRLKTSADGLARLGHVLLYRGRPAEAIPLLAQAVQLDSHALFAWLYLGLAQQQASHAQDAQAAFRRGLALAQENVTQLPRDGYSRAILAYFYAQTGQQRDSGLEAAEALQLAPRHNDTLWMAALAYERSGRRAEALRTLEQAARPMLEDLKRWPEAARLTADPKFAVIFANAGR
ncbi:MAG TPA: tetratricopeptide repeat protein [Bryobacteraceae bacterium]|nr:tetratricopeptide repeat protein [Bryobacteraceae bacterium]